MSGNQTLVNTGSQMSGNQTLVKTGSREPDSSKHRVSDEWEPDL